MTQKKEEDAESCQGNEIVISFDAKRLFIIIILL